MVLHSFYEGKKKYKGFYVDVGAHHPIRFSNTYFFYRRGWKGINIDPTPKSMQPFNLFRRRDINIEVGIGKNTGKFQFFCFNEPALNTFDKGLAEERNTGKYYIKKTIEVPILPLRNILEKYVQKNQKIDFFSIDVEGLDFEVLESNDWERFKPEFILVEDIGFSIYNIKSSIISTFLSDIGYEVVAILQRTVIYKLK